MPSSLDTQVTIKCEKCGKEFEGYKGQKSLCISCFAKQPATKKALLKLTEKPRKAWTPFNVPKLKEEGKWQDLRISIPGNSETWYRVQETANFIGVAVHHTAGPSNQSPESIALYHVNVRGWGGVGYHFLIKPNGTVCYVGDVKTQRAHVANLNHKYIGISMIGTFMGEKPTDEQLRSVYLLNKELIEVDSRFNMSWGEVKRHNELSATACPGDTWPEWWHRIREDPCGEVREDLEEHKELLKNTKTELAGCKSQLSDAEKTKVVYRKLYDGARDKNTALERELKTRDRAIIKLGKERDAASKQAEVEAEKLVNERKIWGEQTETFNNKIEDQGTEIDDLKKEIKLLSYIKGSVAYKVGKFIVELVESIRGGDEK